jgi:hypothetical protein
MPVSDQFSSTPPIALCGATLLLLTCLGGCNRSEIRYYEAISDATLEAKGSMPQDEKSAPAAARKPEAPADETAAARSAVHFHWSLPTGWAELAPDNINAANFRVDADGKARVSLAKLPNLQSQEAFIVNMWRQQVGMTPLEGDALNAALVDAEFLGQPGRLFEVSGSPSGTGAVRIITVFTHRPEGSYFAKLQGEPAVVDASRASFLGFLKSVTADTVADHAAPVAGPFATIPEGWTRVAPGSMQVAKFTVPPQGAATAEVSVSVFPSDTGGTLSNVNRWRGQLGLPPVDEPGLAPLVNPLDPAIPGSEIIDIKGTDRSIVGAIVPRNGEYWFIKLMGATAAVEAARPAFVSFAKTSP